MDLTPTSIDSVSPPLPVSAPHPNSFPGSAYFSPTRTEAYGDPTALNISAHQGLGLLGCNVSMDTAGHQRYPSSSLSNHHNYVAPRFGAFERYSEPLVDTPQTATVSDLSLPMCAPENHFERSLLPIVPPGGFLPPPTFLREQSTDALWRAQSAHHAFQDPTNTDLRSRYHVDSNYAFVQAPLQQNQLSSGKAMLSKGSLSRTPSSDGSGHSSLSLSIGSQERGHRLRKVRRPTTREDANHQCDICGKFFKTTHNYTTHRKIHDPNRAYPYECSLPGCTKKFGRRADRDRHVESVGFHCSNTLTGLTRDCRSTITRRDLCA